MKTADDLVKLLDACIQSLRLQQQRSDERPVVSLKWSQVKALQDSRDPVVEQKKTAFRAFNPKVNVIGKPKSPRRVDTV